MRPRALVIYLAFLWSSVVFAQVGLSSDELKLFNLLNEERSKAGLPEFQWNYHLAESARKHTQVQASDKTLSHHLPGELVLGDRIGGTGLRFDLAAENVAFGSTVQGVHEGLMDSAKHRANILSTKYNAVGLAVIPAEDGLYVTQDFAHTVPTYGEEQFRDAVIAAFNQARHSHRLGAMPARVEPRLHDLACSDHNDAQQMLRAFPTAVNLILFTSSEPENLSASMQKIAADGSLRRMDIGVCFKPSKEHGYASFRVIAVFYPE
ncbi:MAG TPA: CAP domain-containing protein [Candidatus Angelobacter sp.]|nr:CAP domain-containing protein [Candidatus Angelobacter sp.]